MLAVVRVVVVVVVVVVVNGRVTEVPWDNGFVRVYKARAGVEELVLGWQLMLEM
jgi:hypothetical protein